MLNLSGMFNFSPIHLQFLPLKTYQMLKNVQKENKWSKLHCTKCIFWKSILTLPLNFQFVRLCVYRYWYFWRNTLQCVKIIYEDVFELLKFHIFWEGHKILQNLHRTFVLCSASQIIGGDFAKFCGLLRIYELYASFSTFDMF